MSNPSVNNELQAPTLISPNGNETIVSKSLNISWFEPSYQDNQLIWYEILFVDNYTKFEQDEWVQISVVPNGKSLFQWNIPHYIKSNNCRVGIRAIDQKGNKSRISFSADNFAIKAKNLSIPALIEPISNNTYFSYIPFIFDYESLKNTCSERAFYQIYYNSDKQNINWELLKSNIPVDSKPYYFDVSNLPSSDDYIFKIELVDNNSVSEPLFIRNVKIKTLNYFLIDTKPPIGSVNVVNNKEYINTKDIILKLQSYDETTEVDSFRIEQYNLGYSEDIIYKGEYNNVSDVTSWHIKENANGFADGPKLIQIRFKDKAGNVVSDDDISMHFRTYKSIDNIEITSFLISKNGNEYDKWIAFGGDVPYLYKNQKMISSLVGKATSMVIYNEMLYIAVSDDEDKTVLSNDNNRSILQRYSAGLLETVTNTNQYLDNEETVLNDMYYPDSLINSMVVFDDKIWMGLQNGRLMSYNGSSVIWQNENNLFDYSISKLYATENLLFVCFKNSKSLYVVSKNNSGKYIFNEISMES